MKSRRAFLAGAAAAAVAPALPTIPPSGMLVADAVTAEVIISDMKAAVGALYINNEVIALVRDMQVQIHGALGIPAHLLQSRPPWA